MLVRIKEHNPLYGYGVFTTALLLTVMDILFLCMTCFRDPGIIPRNNRASENEGSETSLSMELVASKSCNIMVQRTKDVVYNGYSIKVKFCDTCKLYRPLRASHCSVCNNCVQKFDHHCPWVGQCIGLRNYRFFIFFITTSTLLCIYVFTFSMVNIHMKKGKGKGSLMRSMSSDMASVFLVCYCFVVVWFLGGLTLFHFYLILRNQTTYENFRYRYDKLSNKNPYNLGVFNNVKQTFFTRLPTAINFRQLVLVENPPIPQSISGLGMELEAEISRRLVKSVSLGIPSILQNLDYADDCNDRFNKDSPKDILQINSVEDSTQQSAATDTDISVKT